VGILGDSRKFSGHPYNDAHHAVIFAVAQLSCYFYHTIHYSAKRVRDRSVVRPSVCPSIRLVDCDHISWKTSKIISRLISLRPGLCSGWARAIWCNGNTPKIRVE